jgi:hypothetical protein
MVFDQKTSNLEWARVIEDVLYSAQPRGLAYFAEEKIVTFSSSYASKNFEGVFG